MLRYFVAFSILLATPAFAQNGLESDREASRSGMQKILEARTADAVAVFEGGQEPEDVFSPSFLASVPPAQLALFNAQLSAQFGALLGVESVTQGGPDRAAIVLRFEKALGSGSIAVELNAPHKITELLLTTFETTDDSIERLKADLEVLPGDVGVLFTRLDGGATPVLSINPEKQFAIGSTFKLYILSALARSIEEGERNWADLVTLDRKSFPSGTLQDWPAGSPLTLHTLATLMISISDNTATDLLLHELSRETVEMELLRIGHSDPDLTLPFLSTLEMFALKGSDGNLQKFIAADEVTQRFILADFEDDVGGNPKLVTPPRFTEPKEIETVEWFANAEDLRKLAVRLSEIEDPTTRQIMSINTALPTAVSDVWLYVGYKGGSEPGVLNLTWLLQDEANRWHLLTMSWNNPDANVDETTLVMLAQRVLRFAF